MQKGIRNMPIRLETEAQSMQLFPALSHPSAKNKAKDSKAFSNGKKSKVTDSNIQHNVQILDAIVGWRIKRI